MVKIIDMSLLMSMTGPPHGFPVQTDLSSYIGLGYDCGCGTKHSYLGNDTVSAVRELTGKKFVFSSSECAFLTLVELKGFFSKEFKSHCSSQSEVEDDISVHEMSQDEHYEIINDYIDMHMLLSKSLEDGPIDKELMRKVLQIESIYFEIFEFYKIEKNLNYWDTIINLINKNILTMEKANVFLDVLNNYSRTSNLLEMTNADILNNYLDLILEEKAVYEAKNKI